MKGPSLPSVDVGADFVPEVRALAAAGVPILCVVTHEERRARALIGQAFEGRRVLEWTATRGWTDADWSGSERRLQARGLMDSGGRLTKSGGAQRRDIESLTDRLAAGPVERIGETGVKEAIALAAPIARCLMDAGVVPVPNPVGVPRP